MIRSGRILLLLAALGGAAATTARAQSPAAAPEPDAPSPSASPCNRRRPSLQPPAPPAPPTPTFAPAPLPGPYFEVDPLLDRPPLPQPGWFADADLGAVIPHVKNHLNGPVQLPGQRRPRYGGPGQRPAWTGRSSRASRRATGCPRASGRSPSPSASWTPTATAPPRGWTARRSCTAA